MLNTKLILIEGMAGSGKSTTGEKLLDVLSEKNVQAEFYHEFSKDHPIIDYGETDRNLWIEQTVQRWKKLVVNISKEHKIIVLDAAYFQCTIGELLERGSIQKDINEYALNIQNIIKPTNPVLIYFYQHNIESTLKNVYDSRSHKWQKKVCTFLDNTAFGKIHNQIGYELYLQFNKDLRNITDYIFERTTIQKLAIENSIPDWPKIYKTIFNYLKL